MRNIGLAMCGEAGARGRFPGAGYFHASTGQQYHNWVLSLLPRLERRDIYSLWDLAKLYEDPANRAVGATQINVLICPDDDSIVSGEGNLTYVVNLGVGWTVPNDCPATWRSEFSPTPGVQLWDLNGDGIACPKNGSADGVPHLRSFRDGWRHLRLMLMLSPIYLFLLSGGFQRASRSPKLEQGESAREKMAATVVLRPARCLGRAANGKS